MPNIKSAKKRVEIGERNRKVNIELKSKVRTLIKSSLRTAEAGDEKAVIGIVAQVFRTIDKGTKGSTYHKNKAARLKSRLAKKVKTILDSSK